MKSLLLATLLVAGTVSALDVAAPNTTDYLLKGKAAIVALQEFNF
jgi:hypothetical protein